MKIQSVTGAVRAGVYTLLLFGIQLGQSTTFSVAMLGTICLLSSVKLSIPYLGILAFLQLGLLSLLTAGYMGLDLNFLREARLVAVSVAFVILLRSRLTGSFNYDLMLKATVWIAFLGVLAQFLAHRAGIDWVVPDALFAISDDKALVSEEIIKAEYGGYTLRLRQAFTFSEPSYFGLVLIATNFLSLSKYHGKKKAYAFFLLLFAAATLSGTIYGQVGLLVSTFCWRMRMTRRLALRAFGLLLVLGVVVLAVSSTSDVFGARVEQILSLQDESAYIRIVQPFKLIAYNGSEAPLGIPFSNAYTYYQQLGFYGAEDDPPMQNSLLNLFIYHGYFGLFVIFIFWRLMRTRDEFIFWLLVMFQNGGFFSFDKLFLVCSVVLLARQAKEQMMLRENRGLQAIPKQGGQAGRQQAIGHMAAMPHHESPA